MSTNPWDQNDAYEMIMEVRASVVLETTLETVMYSNETPEEFERRVREHYESHFVWEGETLLEFEIVDQEVLRTNAPPDPYEYLEDM